jgi:CDP-diacylglycerol--serine O-phosphatidyltransferase
MTPLGRRMRRLKTLPVLPTLLTAGNLACGITAILCAAHANGPDQQGFLFWGSIMVFVAMLCDMLDGKVARMTNTQGAFGAELDSLSDVVSFGVAPAILVHRLIIGEPGVFHHGERVLWFCTVFYAVMAAIRLARYNVEHSDEAAPYFRGLPSPGAAALVCAWILVHQQVHTGLAGATEVANGWVQRWFRTEQVMSGYDGLSDLDPFRWFMLGLLVLAALLMVSTIRFPHLGNTLLGRLSFRKLILLMAFGAVFVWKPAAFLVVAISGYLVWGVVGEGLRMWRSWRQGNNPLDEDEDAEDAGLGTDKPSDVGPAPGR